MVHLQVFMLACIWLQVHVVQVMQLLLVFTWPVLVWFFSSDAEESKMEWSTPLTEHWFSLSSTVWPLCFGLKLHYFISLRLHPQGIVFFFQLHCNENAQTLPGHWFHCHQHHCQLLFCPHALCSHFTCSRNSFGSVVDYCVWSVCVLLSIIT